MSAAPARPFLEWPFFAPSTASWCSALTPGRSQHLAERAAHPHERAAVDERCRALVVRARAGGLDALLRAARPTARRPGALTYVRWR